MDYWKMVQKAELQRAQIQQEIAALRLEEQARRNAPRQQSWFARNMFLLGTWMVSAGENLQKRYRATQVSCRVMQHRTAG